MTDIAKALNAALAERYPRSQPHLSKHPTRIRIDLCAEEIGAWLDIYDGCDIMSTICIATGPHTKDIKHRHFDLNDPESIPAIFEHLDQFLNQTPLSQSKCQIQPQSPTKLTDNTSTPICQTGTN